MNEERTEIEITGSEGGDNGRVGAEHESRGPVASGESGDGGDRVGARGDDEEVLDITELLGTDHADAVIEAMLYAADGPLTAVEVGEVIARVMQERASPGRQVIAAVEDSVAKLNARYVAADSALQVIEVAGGYRLATRPRYDRYIRALRQVERPSQLSLPALETLAVVAYKQPVTGAEIASIRGVDPSTALRTLREQGLVRIVGRKRAVGRPFTYGTSNKFLVTFGLRDLDELPDPEEFEELLES